MIKKLVEQPQIYDNLISIYDCNNTSIYETIVTMAKKINEGVDITNEMNEYITYLKETGITEEVLKKVEDAINNGKIETLINDKMFKQLKNEVFLKQNGININDLDEETRQAILENNSIDINYVLGVENVKNINVADNTVDYNNTTFFDIEKSVNVFDYTKAIDGYIVNGEYGTLQEHPEGCVSDYIRVNPGDMLRFDNNWEGCYFDKDKQHHSKKEFGDTNSIVPVGAYFYRHNVNKTLKQSFMMTINKPMPTSYTPFYENIDFNEKTKEILKRYLENEKISVDDTDFATRKSTINLFNKETITNGYIVGNNGLLVPHSGGCVTDFIEVNELEKIYVNSNWNGCCYDKNKNFLWQKEFGSTEFTTPNHTKYIRMSVPFSSIDTYMISKSPINAYKPFEGYFKFTDINDLKSLANQLISTGLFNANNSNNLKWCVLGDSLTEKNSRALKNYHDYISEKEGFNVVNCGVSGTGYMRTKENNTAFYQRVNTIPTDSDIVTIFGSGNDLSLIDSLGLPTDTTTDTICGCINETIKLIFKRLPGVKLGIISPCPWGSYPTNVNDNAMMKYSKAMEEVCKRWGVPYLDLYHTSNMRPWDETFKNMFYKRDNGNSVHPDEDGHKLFYNRIGSFVKSL